MSKRRDLKAAPTFFANAIGTHGEPTAVTTDRAHGRVRVVDDLVPDALHDTTQYPNNPVEADYGRLKGQTPSDARSQTRPDRQHHDPRSRMHSEPAAGTLRTRGRCPSRTDASCSARRARSVNLRGQPDRSRLAALVDTTTQQCRSRSTHPPALDQGEFDRCTNRMTPATRPQRRHQAEWREPNH